MPNYREVIGTSEIRRRSFQVVIDNPLNDTPRVTFQEEEIITLPDGRVMHNPVSGVGEMFDPNGVIDLLDPNTDLPVGVTMTQQQVFLALYSQYIALAKARDAGAA